MAIQYMVSVNTNAEISSKKSVYNLVLKGGQSLYYNQIGDSLNQFKYKDVAVGSEKAGEFIKVQLSDNNIEYVMQDLFYKNYALDTMVFNDKLPVKTKVFVGESLHIIKWDILPSRDTLILGYKCQTATADFRGRKYTAYFSQELNAFGGPWKFDGLPGLILSVRSDDKYLIIEPIKISLNIIKNDIVNPYKNLKKEEVLSWITYKGKYEKKLKEIHKMLSAKSNDGTSFSIKITDGIEDLGIKDVSDK